MKIYFVTGNNGKFASLKRHLAHLGLTHIEVEQASLDIVELQLDSVHDIAVAKAKEAHRRLRAPVLVEDGGFCIEALQDFPGPYTKYVIQTIGPAGLVRLMSGVANRRCRWQGTLVYIDEAGAMHTFDRKGLNEGFVASYVADCLPDYAWSNLWQIYMPEGCNKTLAEFTLEEFNAYDTLQRENSVMGQFAAFMHQMKAAA